MHIKVQDLVCLLQFGANKLKYQTIKLYRDAINFKNQHFRKPLPLCYLLNSNFHRMVFDLAEK